MTGELERRAAQGEVRAEGRRLIGQAMRYGDISPSHNERFEPGAFDLEGTKWLDVRHDPSRVIAWTPGGGLSITDTPEALEVVATLPEIPLANSALEEVRKGKLRGLSVEFRASEERRDGDIRVIQSAMLVGLGLVATPSYQQATVEARARLGRGFRSYIPYGKRLTCGCHRGSCKSINLRRGAFDDALDDDVEVLAISGDYARALASKKKGTLRLRDSDEGLQVEIDLPDSTAGKDLISASSNVPFVIRPYFDQDASDFVEQGDLATYSKMKVRAFLIGATDAAEGWPEAKATPARRAARRRFIL